jgi:hypothetical protein
MQVKDKFKCCNIDGLNNTHFDTNTNMDDTCTLLQNNTSHESPPTTNDDTTTQSTF